MIAPAKSRTVYQGDTISAPALSLSRIFEANDLTANGLQQKMRSMADLQTVDLTQIAVVTGPLRQIVWHNWWMGLVSLGIRAARLVVLRSNDDFSVGVRCRSQADRGCRV